MKKLVVPAFAAVLMCSCTQTATPSAEAPAAAAPASSEAPAAETTAATAEATPKADATAANGAAPAAPSSPGDDAVNKSIDDVLGDHSKYEPVIHAFQQAVASGDKQGVAALVDYPISVNIDGKATSIKDAASFVADYDKFMSPAMTKAISGQKYADLFVNDKGVMFGNGEAWINGVCGDDACKQMDVKVVALQPGGN